MTKFIKKFNKNYFGVILDLFPLNLGKNFPRKKKGSDSFFFLQDSLHVKLSSH